MKILMLTDSLEIGGAESHIELLSRELASMGHKILVASEGGKIQDRLARQGIICFTFSKKRTKHKNLCFTPLVSRLFLSSVRIGQLIKLTKPDIVHAHTRKTAFFAHKACEKYQIPLVVTAHAKFSMKFPKNILSKWGYRTISVSQDIKNHLTKHGVLPQKIEVIPNGVQLSENIYLNTPKKAKEAR